jgi:arylsulfatase A
MNHHLIRTDERELLVRVARTCSVRDAVNHECKRRNNRYTFDGCVLRALLVLFTVARFGFAPLSATAAAAERPNVVFFLIDDLGWADLGCYGSRYYETPQIDQLARRGMQFTDAYAACPACSPTRASILTGKYPARLRLTDWIPGRTPANAKLSIPTWRKYLPSEEVTVAEVLQSAGYATAAIGKWHLGGEPYFPEHQGFDLNVAGSNAGSPGSYFHPYGGRPRLAGGEPGEYLTDRLTDEALSFIQSNQAHPFFLYLAHYAVHTPIQGKPELVEKYQGKPGSNGQKSPAYAAMVESVDQSVGRIVETLDRFGLTDRTVVILFSDNGGLLRPSATSNAPLRSGKGFPYEGGVRVPLIVRWPGVVRSGSVCCEVVTSVDFYPTLLEIASVQGGRRHNADVDGVSLIPLLKENGPLARDAVYWHYPHYNPIGGYPYGAVRQGEWKLIEFYEGMHVELYNLKDDIGEKADLAEAKPEFAATLRAKLHDWRRSVGAQMTSPNPNYRPAPQSVRGR